MLIVAVATAMEAGLQVVHVDAAAGRANHSEVTTGSDVDGLDRYKKSRDPDRKLGGGVKRDTGSFCGVTVATVSLR